MGTKQALSRSRQGIVSVDKPGSPTDARSADLRLLQMKGERRIHPLALLPLFFFWLCTKRRTAAFKKLEHLQRAIPHPSALPFCFLGLEVCTPSVSRACIHSYTKVPGRALLATASLLPSSRGMNRQIVTMPPKLSHLHSYVHTWRPRRCSFALAASAEDAGGGGGGCSRCWMTQAVP